MKKYLIIILSFISTYNYAQDNRRIIPNEIVRGLVDFPNATRLILNQHELEKKYLDEKKYVMYNSIKYQFLNSNNSDSEIVQLIKLDLNNIIAFDSDEMCAATYKVIIGEDLDDFNQPKTLYNLVHLYKKSKGAYLILLRYDFSNVSYKEYVNDPKTHANIVSFIPLTKIDNIYENIVYSIAKELLIHPYTLDLDSPYYLKLIDFANCAQSRYVKGEACKVCGLHFQEKVDGKTCQHKAPHVRPKPDYTFLDLSDCDKSKKQNEKVDYVFQLK